MEFRLWVVIGILICVILGLLTKLFLMRKAAREINSEFAKRLVTDTNTLIDLSHQDRTMRELATSINMQLGKLRDQRHRFQQGDLELKEAVTNISHDLRTPLTAICGYLDLLDQETDSENITRYLAQIKNRTETMKQLTEELFHYSIVTSSKEADRETVDLCRLLEESLVSFYGVMTQNGLTPDILIPETAVNRFLDPIAVHRIFSNIISNALKYSDGDFAVKMDADGTILFSNGAKGLSSVSIERLFNRFYTVETGRNSTGLGLSIAKLLTEQMGGKIDAEYRDETLFITIRFPNEYN